MKATVTQHKRIEVDIELPYYFEHKSTYYAILDEETSLAVYSISINKFSAQTVLEYVGEPETVQKSADQFKTAFDKVVNNLSNLLKVDPCLTEN